MLFRCFPSALISWRFYWAAAVVKWRRREEKSKLGLWRFGSGVFLMFLFRMLPCGDGGELSRVYCALFWWLLGLAPADLGSYEGLLVGLWTLNSMGSKLLQLFILYCVTESRVKKRMIFECPLLDLRAPSAGSTVWDVFRLCLSVRFELLPQGLNGIWTCWSDSYCWVRWDKKKKKPWTRRVSLVPCDEDQLCVIILRLQQYKDIHTQLQGVINAAVNQLVFVLGN